MIKRLNDLRLEDNKAYRRIAERQRNGTMSYLVDSDGYICYDTEELKNWRPRKAGRKPTFKCEICGKTTPMMFEGGEPNCCEDCVPLTEEQLLAREKGIEWQKISRTHKYYMASKKARRSEIKEK